LGWILAHIRFKRSKKEDKYSKEATKVSKVSQAEMKSIIQHEEKGGENRVRMENEGL